MNHAFRSSNETERKSAQSSDRPGILKVLLVEDDPVDRMAFERYVDRHSLPYSLSTANCVRDAANILQKQVFDAVVCDFNLPDGTAIDVIAKAESVPTVVVTGVGSELIAVETMKAGARDYLVKDHERAYLHLMPLAVANAVERHRLEQERERLIVELQQALADIKTLRGLLPICARCKKIRDDKGYWTQMEMYIQRHSGATFSHGLCPACSDQMIAEVESRMKQSPPDKP